MDPVSAPTNSPFQGTAQPLPTEGQRRNLTMPPQHHQGSRHPQGSRKSALTPAHDTRPGPGPEPEPVPGLNLEVHPTFPQRPVAEHALCRLTALMFQQPGLTTSQLTSACPWSSTSLSCVNSDLQPCPCFSSSTSEQPTTKQSSCNDVTPHTSKTPQHQQQQQVQLLAQHQVRQVHEQTQTQTQHEKHKHEMTRHSNSRNRRVELRYQMKTQVTHAISESFAHLQSHAQPDFVQGSHDELQDPIELPQCHHLNHTCWSQR